MTQRVQVHVECDPCQVEGGPENLVPGVTRTIVVDGVEVEVDVCEIHGKQVDVFAEWLVEVGRVAGRRRVPKHSSPTTAGESFVCPACGHVAPNLQTLRTHARNMHDGLSLDELAGTATIPCPDCERRFGSKQGLAQHRRQNHGYVAGT
jgi:transcription elongation factor Elf1